MEVNEACPGCKENIDFLNAYARFDVKKAIEIVKDGRVTHDISVTELLNLLSSAKIYARHIFHVNPDEPIILAQVQDIIFPIDGLHRISRAHQEKRKIIKALLLTEEETKNIIIQFSNSSKLSTALSLSLDFQISK